MTSVYMVTYDLSRGANRYEGLLAELADSPAWWHYLESTWLIATDENADELWERLRGHTIAADNVLVMEVRDDSQGNLPPEAWTWIEEHVPPP